MAKSRSGVSKIVVGDLEDIKTRPANYKAVEVMRQTDGEEEMSTSQKLFGDLYEETEKDKPPKVSEPIQQSPLDETPVEEPKKEEVKQEEPKAPVEEPEKTEQTPPLQQEDEFLDLDKLASKKVKAKIDGKEESVTLKDLRDQYQIRKHLDWAADKVGEERRKLAEERRQLQELRQRMNPSEPVQPVQPGGIDPNGAYNVPRGTQPEEQQALYAKVNFLEQRLNEVMEGTRPVLYESNRQRVSNELKSMGFNDFFDYIPKMESFLVNLQDPQMMTYYDTPIGAKALYFQLKAQELNESRIKTPAATVPVAPAAIQPAPVANRPPITKLEGGSQPSSGTNDDSALQYRQSFRKATSLGDDKEAWNEVLRKKGILPEE